MKYINNNKIYRIIIIILTNAKSLKILTFGAEV